MKTVTTRVGSDTHDKIEARADDSDRSKSAVARDLIEKGLEYDELQNERDRLERQLRATNQRIDDVTELVQYVDQQQSLEERRERRRSAPAWTRAKWWLFGEPTDGDHGAGDSEQG